MSTGYSTPVSAHPTSPLSPEAKLALHLHGSTHQSMDGGRQEYQQSGLSSPYTTFPEPQSEGSSADPASAAQYNPQGQDPRAANFSSSATPTSEYGINPSSARSGSFPDYIQRQQYASAQSANAGGMAQATNPSIAAATSPTYPPQNQYSPYPPQHEMQPQYQGPPMYRPEWGAHYPAHMQYGHAPASSGPPAPAMVSPVQRPPTVRANVISQLRPTYYTQGGHPLSTVYSFVPIPGAQQHKRPRRRYEEIERMYKCGWDGCEKAYGTLNHLNAHVTMQSHGAKRTPEGEFKISSRLAIAPWFMQAKQG